MDSLLARYKRALQPLFPKGRLQSVELNLDGQFNDVLIVNDRLIFRFAKVEEAHAGLETETALLRSLQGRLPLPVPAPIHARFDEELAFMGYRMIPGKPLRRSYLAGARESERAIIAGRLARFLQTLHRIDPTEVLPEPDENEDAPEAWADMYDRIRAELFPHMRPDARSEVAAHFDGYFKDPALSTFTPRLRHGDFGPGNILFDPEEGALTGIIDFGSAGVGDPAADFAALLSSYGEEFYRRCARTYPDMLAVLPRAHFYIGTFALQEALFGAENDDSEAFEAGMAPYR